MRPGHTWAPGAQPSGMWLDGRRGRVRGEGEEKGWARVRRPGHAGRAGAQPCGRWLEDRRERLGAREGALKGRAPRRPRGVTGEGIRPTNAGPERISEAFRGRGCA